jgi:UMF1 family MFS transporter
MTGGVAPTSVAGTPVRPREVWSWALYDWANSAFSLSVLTVFVPVLLGGLWNDGAESTVTTFRLGLANGLASAVVVLLAPVLGAVTDQARRRKPWLALLTALGVAATAGLFGLGAGDWPLAVALFVLASIGFFGANALYDAMLMDVAAPRDYDRVSALGYGLGYLGGALAFALSVIMVAAPTAFGLADETAAARWSFLVVAAWWAVFSLPLLLWVRERQAGEPAPGLAFLAGFRQLGRTLRLLRGQRNLLLFLAAYWLYIDGVYTIIKMAVDYGLSQGLSTRDVTFAILLTNFIGFPAAILFGRLGEWLGPKAAIFLTLGVYMVATGAAVFLTTALEFYLLAAAIGCVQGGVQSLSRSLYARLVPAAERGEYFGFYNMLGKFSSILGPVLAGTAALVAGSQRFGILSILVLFAAGAWLLTRVRVPPAG